MKIFFTFLALSLSIHSADFSVTEKKGDHVDVSYKGRSIFKFMTARDSSTKERDHDTYKVYSHIVDPLDKEGKAFITKGPGGKFTHHRGIFFGFNKVKSGSINADLWHMRGAARNNFIKILKQEAGDDQLVLTVEVDWVNGETVVLKEERQFTISKPEANGALLIDLKSKLTAVNADTVLAGDPEHAGCHFRADNEVNSNKSAKFLIPAGKDVKKSSDIPWTAMTYKLRSNQYYVHHMSSPKNGQWKYSAYRNYGRFGSFPFGHEIKKGESANFHFAFYISPGNFPEDAEAQMQKRYESVMK